MRQYGRTGDAPAGLQPSSTATAYWTWFLLLLLVTTRTLLQATRVPYPSRSDARGEDPHAQRRIVDPQARALRGHLAAAPLVPSHRLASRRSAGRLCALARRGARFPRPARRDGRRHGGGPPHRPRWTDLHDLAASLGRDPERPSRPRAAPPRSHARRDCPGR